MKTVPYTITVTTCLELINFVPNPGNLQKVVGGIRKACDERQATNFFWRIGLQAFGGATFNDTVISFQIVQHLSLLMVAITGRESSVDKLHRRVVSNLGDSAKVSSRQIIMHSPWTAS